MKIITPCLVALAFVAILSGNASAHRRALPPTSAPDTTIMRVSGGAIDSALRSLAASTSSSDIARDLPTGDLTRYQVVVLSRRVVAAAELHERWSDVVFVRSGAAVLRTGRVLAGQQSKGQGEFSGTAIVSGRDRAVGPGDVLVIPAGLAHQWRPTGTAAFTYVVLKMRAGRATDAAVRAR